MLNMPDLALLVATAAVCTGIVMLVAVLALRWNTRGSVASQVTIIVAAATVSIVFSTVAVVMEMFISTHDLIVLCWIIGVSAALSLAIAWLITRRTVRISVTALMESAQRIGDGGVVAPAQPGTREVNDLSAQLADTSEKLAGARAEIERLDAARRQFFAWISHDLRTPLTGIRAATEALDSGVAPDQHQYAALVQSRVDALGRMVDDLFELSKLESGTLTLQPELVVLLDLISDAVVDVQAEARQRGIRITQVGVEGHMLWADPRELTRAIGNLLANGIRYAPESSEIVVSAHSLDDGRLVLGVLDHGSGVSSEDLGHLFDVGWRASAARSADVHVPGTTGAGLGLAIVRGIAEAHGGDVRALTLNDGFRVDLVLPMTAP